jgi:hypothetical protein
MSAALRNAMSVTWRVRYEPRADAAFQGRAQDGLSVATHPAPFRAAWSGDEFRRAQPVLRTRNIEGPIGPATTMRSSMTPKSACTCRVTCSGDRHPALTGLRTDP